MHWRQHIGRYGSAWLPGAKWVRISFLLLWTLAAVLRFWNLAELPYTHDELSALLRIYPSLGETIAKGVAELDTHPPGVQVFEWCWTRLFSFEEADVKLPFILMDLAAMLLLFRFAMAWTGDATALVLSTLMAALQYTVLYGQIARPYAFGLFTTALLADQLTRYWATGLNKYLIRVGLAAVLSAYAHHFALLLAGIMLASGLLLVEREQRIRYLMMCLAVALLYAPNVPIFVKQLDQGGLDGWLQPPRPEWFSNYAWFIANNSVVLALLLTALVLLSCFRLLRNKPDAPLGLWLLLLWSSAPLLIGYFYSVWRAPVIQYSVVLFSFPYLVLVLTYGLARLPRRGTLIACGLMAWSAVHSLVTERKHYALFYRSKYEAMLRTGLEAYERHGRTLVLFDAPDNVLRFYSDLWRTPTDSLRYVQLRDTYTPGQLDSLLAASPAEEVVYGQSNGAAPEHVALVQARFPYLVERQDLLDGQVFRFARNSRPVQTFDRDTLTALVPGRPNDAAWSVSGSLDLLLDSTGTPNGWDYTGQDFGLGVDLSLDSISYDPADQLEIIAMVDGWDAASEAHVIADVRTQLPDGRDSTVFYRGGPLHPKSRPSGTVAMAVTVSRADILVEGPLRLRAYVFSPTKGPLHVRSMTVMRRQANPIRYGTLEPVPWLGRFRAK